MTVYELCEFYVDEEAEVRIWSGEEESQVFLGTFHSASLSKYADKLIGSFGIEDGVIVINI